MRLCRFAREKVRSLFTPPGSHCSSCLAIATHMRIAHEAGLSEQQATIQQKVSTSLFSPVWHSHHGIVVPCR